jgi:hypothetical protein
MLSYVFTMSHCDPDREQKAQDVALEQDIMISVAGPGLLVCYVRCSQTQRHIL